ncbi:MAG: aminopeptidase [Clostridia bacterium]|nr:aminopeptidase [Clostridia bacterium]
MEIDKLMYEPEYVFEKLTDNQKDEMEKLCGEYRAFLDAGKTERECVSAAVAMAEKAGFVSFDSASELNAGDKIYIVNRKKNILLAVIGKSPLTEGISLVGAHVDSPRLDLKQNPLYESSNMSLLKTHYYGGIKKYQWTAMPLALHGVMFTSEGKQVDISIGEDEDDPVFCVTDLLPHLAKDQMSKKLSEAIEGEALNILFGGFTIDASEKKDKFKKNILSLMYKKYGVSEKNFLSAELEAVPAFKAKNVGLDGAFVGAYGQDDRVCAFTSLKAILDVDMPDKTSVCLLVDKEEIGSCGNTGMLSDFFRFALAEIAEKQLGSCDYLTLSRILKNSSCLSSDVGAAVDPNYEGVTEKQNAAYAGCGMVLMKYTGARGKSGSSDASAEFVYRIGKILDDNGVFWQTSELGKVDQGGGGTIAQYVANLNMDVIDCGVPVLSMHSPFEVTAKTDIYMAYLSYVAFYKCN